MWIYIYVGFLASHRNSHHVMCLWWRAGSFHVVPCRPPSGRACVGIGDGRGPRSRIARVLGAVAAPRAPHPLAPAGRRAILVPLAMARRSALQVALSAALVGFFGAVLHGCGGVKKEADCGGGHKVVAECKDDVLTMSTTLPKVDGACKMVEDASDDDFKRGVCKSGGGSPFSLVEVAAKVGQPGGRQGRPHVDASEMAAGMLAGHQGPRRSKGEPATSLHAS